MPRSEYGSKQVVHMDMSMNGNAFTNARIKNTEIDVPTGGSLHTLLWGLVAWNVVLTVWTLILMGWIVVR